MLYPPMVPGPKADTGVWGYTMTTRFRWPRLCSGSSQRRPPPIRDVSHQMDGPGFQVASGSRITTSTSFAIKPSSIGPADTSWEIPANGPKMPNIDPIAPDSPGTIRMDVDPKEVRADQLSGICILVHHLNLTVTRSRQIADPKRGTTLIQDTTASRPLGLIVSGIGSVISPAKLPDSFQRRQASRQGSIQGSSTMRAAYSVPCSPASSGSPGARENEPYGESLVK